MINIAHEILTNPSKPCIYNIRVYNLSFYLFPSIKSIYSNNLYKNVMRGLSFLQ